MSPTDELVRPCPPTWELIIVYLNLEDLEIHSTGEGYVVLPVEKNSESKKIPNLCPAENVQVQR